MGEDLWKRALEIQRELATESQHRSASMVDLLLSVVAANESLTVLHYDRDFETIAEVTGQPTEWVVPAGTV